MPAPRAVLADEVQVVAARPRSPRRRRGSGSRASSRATSRSSKTCCSATTSVQRPVRAAAGGAPSERGPGRSARRGGPRRRRRPRGSARLGGASRSSCSSGPLDQLVDGRLEAGHHRERRPLRRRPPRRPPRRRRPGRSARRARSSRRRARSASPARGRRARPARRRRGRRRRPPPAAPRSSKPERARGRTRPACSSSSRSVSTCSDLIQRSSNTAASLPGSSPRVSELNPLHIVGKLRHALMLRRLMQTTPGRLALLVSVVALVLVGSATVAHYVLGASSGTSARRCGRRPCTCSTRRACTRTGDAAERAVGVFQVIAGLVLLVGLLFTFVAESSPARWSSSASPTGRSAPATTCSSSVGST